MKFTDVAYSEFCKKTSVYPPSAMVTDSTTKKVEERWIRASEKMYSLSNPLLSELRQSHKDMMVCSLFMENIKYPYLAGMIGTFGAYMEHCFKYLKTECNKDPDLKKYFVDVYSEYEGMYKNAFNTMQESLGTDQDCIDAYQEKFKSTSKNLKERFK